jgi:hypothetical protein
MRWIDWLFLDDGEWHRMSPSAPTINGVARVECEASILF